MDSSKVIGYLTKDKRELLDGFRYYPDQQTILFELFPEETDNEPARNGLYKGPIRYVLYDIGTGKVLLDRAIEKGVIKKFGSGYYFILKEINSLIVNKVVL
jgi:hypothetical protein